MPVLNSGGSLVTSDSIVDGSIVNADINAAANIALSKLNNPAYVTLADVTLSGVNTVIDSGAFAAKSILKILVFSAGHAVAASWGITFNNDSGANYNTSISENGGAAGTSAANTQIPLAGSALTDVGMAAIDVINIATLKKMAVGLQMTEVYCRTIGGQWENVADPITQVKAIATNNFAIGSRLVVLGMN